MANYRSIHVKIWTDPKIEPLPPDARYLFLYLITNEHRNESGLYSLTIRTMSNETGLSPRRVDVALQKLDRVRRVAYDGVEGVVWVVNAAKHTPMNDNCIKSIERDLEFCSSSILKESFCVRYANHLNLQAVVKRFANGSKTVWDGFIEPTIQGIGYKVQGTGYRDIEEPKERFGEFVFLTVEERQRLVIKYNEEDVTGCIEALNLYLGQSKKNQRKYDSHYHVILKWAMDSYKEKKNGNQPKRTTGRYTGFDEEKYKRLIERGKTQP